MKPIFGNKLVRPVYRSEFTAEHMCDGQTRFDPDGYQKWNRNGKPLVHIDVEETSNPDAPQAR